MRKPSPLLKTLRGQLALLVCISTLPAILFTFYIAVNERNAAFERMEEDASHLASLASREHVRQIEGSRNLLRWLGGQLAAEGDGSPVLAEADFLPALLQGYPYANIGALAPDGKVLRSAYPLASFPNMGDNPAVVRALRSREVETGEYIIGPIVRIPVLNMAYAVRDGDGRARWVVFNALNLKWLGQLARQADLPSEYSLMIADRDGRVLAESGSLEKNSLGRSNRSIPEIAELGLRKGGKLLKVSDAGIRRFLVAAPLGEIPGLFVVVGLPYERVYGETNRIFNRTLGSLAALTLFAMGSVLVAAEVSILRSLRSLSRAMVRFGSGALSTRAALPKSPGELRDLTKAFNQMADALAARGRELAEAQDRLRALSQRLQVARETEAGRIARELHDEIGQALTSIKIDLSSLSRHCRTDGANASCVEKIESSIASMNERIDGSVDFVRRIASELRPAVLDRLGLAAALEWLARELDGRTNLTVAVNVRDAGEPMEELTSTTLFRIAQEALTNVARHASATTVRIDLSGDADEIVLTVRDDGKGIDEKTAESSGSLGIVGMQERARLVGGTFAIGGDLGEGAVVTVRIPRRRAGEESHAHPAG